MTAHQQPWSHLWNGGSLWEYGVDCNLYFEVRFLVIRGSMYVGLLGEANQVASQVQFEEAWKVVKTRKLCINSMYLLRGQDPFTLEHRIENKVQTRRIRLLLLR